MRMIKLKLKQIIFVSFIFLALCAFSISTVNASGGSIVMLKTYPENNGVYDSVDHFLYQVTGINTNTTISVSIDGGPQIPMLYQGTKNGTSSDDTLVSEWYTWQVTNPNELPQGEHSLHFFGHCYVWQEMDHYWAEFNTSSAMETFTITSSSTTSTAAKSDATKPSICNCGDSLAIVRNPADCAL
jgi:hypothetical protein